jgi:methylenetetrahydrofolate reductase (NADPH)
MTSTDAGSALAQRAVPDEIRQIAAFAKLASFETTLLTASQLDEVRALASAGTVIYVSAIPSRPLDEQVATVKELRSAGFEPVPHLAARNFSSIKAMESHLRRLVTEAGVRRALIIGGDRDQPAGTLADALTVIDSGVLQECGIVDIGIAGHPEGHPRVDNDTLQRALIAKLEAAERGGLNARLVTQFTMSTNPIVEWIARQRSCGVTKQICVGLAGPASLKTLLRFARICGVQTSARGLARNTGLVKNLFGASTADPIVRALAERAGELGDIAPHFFSFGGLAETVRWVGAVAAGRIAIGAQEGFQIIR